MIVESLLMERTPRLKSESANEGSKTTGPIQQAHNHRPRRASSRVLTVFEAASRLPTARR
jgi:hypothetical protein